MGSMRHGMDARLTIKVGGHESRSGSRSWCSHRHGRLPPYGCDWCALFFDAGSFGGLGVFVRGPSFVEYGSLGCSA